MFVVAITKFEVPHLKCFEMFVTQEYAKVSGSRATTRAVTPKSSSYDISKNSKDSLYQVSARSEVKNLRCSRVDTEFHASRARVQDRGYQTTFPTTWEGNRGFPFKRFQDGWLHRLV